MALAVKICGLTRETDVDAAVHSGANLVGFVFFPPSPRSISVARAAELTKRVPKDVIKVALSVDADDALLADITANAGIDMMQFHGSEPPQRVAEARARYGLPMMKALAIAGAEDVDRARRYEAVADWLMFDAKPPRSATRPGGNALAFDWQLVAGESWEKPWLLAGGLTPENVREAVRISGAAALDVSSGVEDEPGIKNAGKIRQFIVVAKGLEA